MIEYFVDLALRAGHWGYLIVFVIVLLECQALVGLFMPGESLVVMSGFLAGRGVFHLDVLIATIAVAAIIGDSIGFELGRNLGRGWLLHYGKWFGVRESTLKKTESYFERHGGKSVFFSHFLHLLRAFMPFIAGAGRMRYWQFLVPNAIGCLLWATVFTLLGYFFGENWDLLEKWIGRAGAVLGGVLLVIVAFGWSWGWTVRHEIAEPSEREAEPGTRPQLP
jgi:membrane protein DedA with SNARE-associated domain